MWQDISGFREVFQITSGLKSNLQFINLVSRSNLEVGTALESCTPEVQPANEFMLDGMRVLLIDTPGFDDSTETDTAILKKIAEFLATE